MYTFPAGKYYVGDPCYVVKDRSWLPLLKRTNYFADEFFTYRKRGCFATSTMYGDGGYKDKYGNIFSVDAGLLGVIPIESCDVSEKTIEKRGLGKVFEFSSEFRVWSDAHCTLYFGNNKIVTDDQVDDDQVDDDEEDDDNDDE